MNVLLTLRDGNRPSLAAASVLLRRPTVNIVGVIADDRQVGGFRRAMAALRAPSAAPLRFASAIADRLTRCTYLVRDDELWDFLESAFPDRVFRTKSLLRSLRIPVWSLRELMAHPEGATRMPASDLGIWLSPEAAPAPLPVAPRLGWATVGNCLDHCDCYWELDRQKSEAVAPVLLQSQEVGETTIVAEARTTIHPTDNAESVRIRLAETAASLIAERADSITESAVRTHNPEKREPVSWKTRYRLDVASRAKTPPLKAATKALYSLALWHSGLSNVLQRLQLRSARRTAAIVLYHRIDETLRDGLSVTLEQFARQMLALKGRFEVVPTTRFVEMLRQREIPPRTIAIQFDDCYRSVYTEACPVLKALDFPACAFVASGFVDTDRRFAHDGDHCPHPLPNLTRADLACLVANGFEIGAHTVNHVDLGKTDAAVAVREIRGSRADLAEATGKEIRLFAVPFGREHNATNGTIDILRSEGFDANFYTYGLVFPKTADPYIIPRVGAPPENVLEFLLHLEGLSLRQLTSRLFRSRTSLN